MCTFKLLLHLCDLEDKIFEFLRVDKILHSFATAFISGNVIKCNIKYHRIFVQTILTYEFLSSIFSGNNFTPTQPVNGFPPAKLKTLIATFVKCYTVTPSRFNHIKLYLKNFQFNTSILLTARRHYSTDEDAAANATPKCGAN